LDYIIIHFGITYWDVKEKKYKVEKGNYRIEVGTSSDDIRLGKEISL